MHNSLRSYRRNRKQSSGYDAAHIKGKSEENNCCNTYELILFEVPCNFHDSFRAIVFAGRQRYSVQQIQFRWPCGEWKTEENRSGGENYERRNLHQRESYGAGKCDKDFVGWEKEKTHSLSRVKTYPNLIGLTGWKLKYFYGGLHISFK